ncbi:hypothetical protein V1517DRAFT_365833 [Lipomyces orientalis]|uniref:Uncharacterized protein n=1 Tax=Lipomyces orientalis TaxID=1233043 RepID=A0ACC3TUF8_9ASCO
MQGRSRKRKLSLTVDRASIGMAENFWRESTLGLSQEWSLNTTTVSAGICGSPRSIVSNSWFSIQVHPQNRTRPPSSRKTTRLSLIIRRKRRWPTSSKMRARKIRVFPTTSQKETLRQCFGTQRYIYNKCAAVKELRGVLLNSETNTLDDNEKWLDQYEYDLKDEAIRDFMKNYRSNMAKYQKDKKDKKPFTLRFRSKKAPTQSLSVLKKKWNRGKRSFYPYSHQPLPTILASDSRLLRTRLGRYFLIVAKDAEEKRKSATRGDFVFIDPGVRIFLTCYDSNENVVEVGRCAVVRVQSRLAALRNYQKRQNLRRADLRLGERINHLVEDMHKKTATFLCANYDNIFLPKLNFHTCRKLNRNLSRHKWWKSKRSGRPRRARVVDPRCLSAKDAPRSFDRDFNASKNIMLKYFTERMMSSGSVSWDAATLGPSPAIQRNASV